MALLNDGKYGHHALGNELGISLLRSPVYPDPLADEGRQSFTYALYPHAGDWFSGGVLAEAEDLNQPLLCRAASRIDTERSWTAVAIDGHAARPQRPQAGRGRQRSGAQRLRAGRRRGTVTATPAGAWSIAGAVNLLEDLQGPADMDVLPFALRSWKLERAGK